nr:hypothetical protein [Tanacetum cinerariifolium]
LSPTKPVHDLSHTTRPSAPIIEDWVSDSEEESQTKAPQVAPSFAQSSEHVKYSRHSVQSIETTILAATPTPVSPKSNSSGKRRNRKACFVCKSVDHLIKDCNFHAKQMTKPTQRNYGNKGYHTQPVSAARPNISVTRPRYAHQDFTKSKSPIRRHITRHPSSKSSNSPPRVTAVQAPMVSVAQVKQGTWGNPQQALKDKGVIDSGCSRYMTGNMYYLSDFEELNGGYVAFGGTFMPPIPDLVFHTAPTAVETDHLAFNVQLSPIKPEQDLAINGQDDVTWRAIKVEGFGLEMGERPKA